MTPDRPYVSFRCDAFNTTEDRPDYEAPGNFGDDVASWLADRLAERGWEVDAELEQDERGWGFRFGRDRDSYWLNVTSLNPDEARWLAWIQSEIGFFGRLFGAERRPIPADALTAVQECLASDPLVHEIRWHTRQQFSRGDLEEGPGTPL